MSIRADLLKLLSRIDNLRTVEYRKSVLALVGLEGLVDCHMKWEDTNLVFFHKLLNLLCFEGQGTLLFFLETLLESNDWLGWEKKQSLILIIDNIRNLTLEEWEREFLGSSNSNALSRIPFILPQSDVSTFTGRKEELQKLEELLLKNQGSKVCSIVGLSGGGGIGKSALASHFATIHKDKFPDGVIGLRVDGKDADTVAREFVRRCGENLEIEDDRDAMTLMQDVFAHRQMLLIFDNAVDAVISKLRPRNSRCAVIITTRNRNLPNSLDIPTAGAIHLNCLSEEDSLILLKKILGDERVNAELAAAQTIIRLVGNLPLALQVVGAALRGNPRKISDYTASLKKEKDRLSRLIIRENDNLNVDASLNLSIEPLSKKEKYFFACLSICAEDGFARRTAMATAGCEDEWEAADYLDRLCELSLLNYTETGEYRFVLHPLVRVYAKKLAQEFDLFFLAQERHAIFFVEWLQSDDVENANIVTEIAMNLDDVILAAEWLQTCGLDNTEKRIETYKFALKLQPLFEQYGHWQKAITLMVQSQSWAEQLNDWNSVVRYKMHEARYLSFSESFDKAVEILHSAQIDLEKIDDLDTRKKREAKLLAVLGGIFQKQGDKEKAINAFRDEILVEEQINDNRALAIACNRLGILLQSQGHFKEAEEAFERQIATSCGRNQLARGWNCLGGLFQEQGKLAEAQNTFEQHIKIQESLDNKTSLSILLNRLGGLYQQQGKLKEAQDVFKKRINVLELSDDKLSLSVALNRLGRLYQQQGRSEEAQDIFKKQIDILESLEDELSPSIVLNRLGGLFQQQGKLKEAQDVFKKQISVLESLDDKLSLSITLNRLGGLFQQQGQLEEAQDALERQIKIATILENQNQIARGLYCLSRIFQEQGYLTNAIIAAKLCVCAETNIGISKSLSIALLQVSQLLKIADKIPEAIIILQRIAQIEEELKNSQGVAMTLSSLASLQRDRGDLDDACNTFLCILNIEKKLKNKKSCASILANLGYIDLQRKKFDTAIGYYNDAVVISKECGDPEVLILTLDGMGKALHQYGKFISEHLELADENYDFLEETQELIFKINPCIQVAWVLHTLGRVWKLRGNLTKAEIVLNRSKEILEDENDTDNLVKVLSTLGNILQKQQRWRDSEIIFRECYDLIEESDRKGQAIVANNLGQVIASQEGNDKFELAEMYFNYSIKVGIELTDREHLAKVYTAKGKAYLSRRIFDTAINELSKGFDIDESLANIRGLKIITPSLMYALNKKGRREEAISYRDRVLKIDPNYHLPSQLHDRNQINILSTHQNIVKIGSVLYIRVNGKDNSRWGQIKPRDGSLNVTFNENFIGSKSMSSLTQGALVKVEIKEKNGKLYAIKVELIEGNSQN